MRTRNMVEAVMGAVVNLIAGSWHVQNLGLHYELEEMRFNMRIVMGMGIVSMR